MAATLGLVLDCADPHGLAEFWTVSARLPQRRRRRQLRRARRHGDAPKLLLQAVTEPKTTKNRMHFDIETPDVDAEVARLEAIGARRLEAEARHEHGTTWVVLADPEGNEFCVCDGGSGPTSAGH